MEFAYLNTHITLTLTMDELRFIHQAFNEVCHGLRIESFNSRIGDIEDVKKEMQSIASIYENLGNGHVGMVQLELCFHSMKLCQRVIKAVCDEVEYWEFQSRMGETRERAIEIHADFQKVLDGLKSENPYFMSVTPLDKFGKERWSACVDLLCQPLDTLDAVQRPAALAFHYDGDVRNGGHSSHFDSMYVAHDIELIQALRNMGAGEQARILAEARLLNGEANTAKGAEQESLWELIAELDQRFYRARPSIEEILIQYFEANKTHFPE